MLVAQQNGTAVVRDKATGVEQWVICGPSPAVLAVAWSPDGQTLLTGSVDGIVRVWPATSGPPIGQFVIHQGAVRAVAFSPDGRMVLTGEDRTARLWDLRTGRPIGPTLVHDAIVTTVAFSADGQTLLTGTEDQTGWRWPRPLVPAAPDELFLLWAEFVTGTSIDAGGNLRALDAATWRQYRERLEVLGQPWTRSRAALDTDSDSNP
jgi:WD40 repeat protein